MRSDPCCSVNFHGSRFHEFATCRPRSSRLPLPQYAEVSRKNDDEELSDVGLLEPAIPGMCEEDGL